MLPAASSTRTDFLEEVSKMSECVNFHFEIDGDNFTSAGEASVRIKKLLRQMEFNAEIIRRVSVAMYEGEIIWSFTPMAERQMSTSIVTE